MTVDERLRAVVERAGRRGRLAGVVAAVERPAHGLRWTGAYGECTPDTEFFVASTTKLHTAAIVFRLADRGALRLDDRVVDILDADDVAGLHVRRGRDRTGEITVRHLLAQTSGLADYFQGRRPDGGSLESALKAGRDQTWTTADALDAARRIGAAFPPGARGKALYSDTNYQLLGMVIERVTGGAYEHALRREVIAPLGLGHTRLYTDPTDSSPLPLRLDGQVLAIPRAMTCFAPDGGVVSTAGDLMTFVRAYVEGGLFDPAVFGGFREHNRIFFPLRYGVGFARFSMPRALGGDELIGHSGLSGAFAFVAPSSGTYVTGTVNDIADPGRSFRLMLRLVRAARSR